MTRRAFSAMLTAPFTGLVEAAGSPIRILLVTGGHDHPPTFYSIFDVPGFEVNVNPHPNAFTSDMRKRYDVVVLYDMIKTGLEEKKRANLRVFAESGKGIVVVHHALCSHGDWPWWYEELTGARWIEPGTPGLPASVFKEGLDLDITPVAPDHPVVAGVPAFRVHDETYGKLWFSPKNQVLVKTTHPTSDGPVIWIGPYRQSRVVTVQLGHGSEAHRNPNYRKLIHNAVRWSAGGPAL